MISIQTCLWWPFHQQILQQKDGNIRWLCQELCAVVSDFIKITVLFYRKLRHHSHSSFIHTNHENTQKIYCSASGGFGLPVSGYCHQTVICTAKPLGSYLLADFIKGYINKLMLSLNKNCYFRYLGSVHLFKQYVSLAVIWHCSDKKFTFFLISDGRRQIHQKMFWRVNTMSPAYQLSWDGLRCAFSLYLFPHYAQ